MMAFLPTATVAAHCLQLSQLEPDCPLPTPPGSALISPFASSFTTFETRNKIQAPVLPPTVRAPTAAAGFGCCCESFR